MLRWWERKFDVNDSMVLWDVRWFVKFPVPFVILARSKLAN